jgi:hypothetical protein
MRAASKTHSRAALRKKGDSEDENSTDSFGNPSFAARN